MHPSSGSRVCLPHQAQIATSPATTGKGVPRQVWPVEAQLVCFLAMPESPQIGGGQRQFIGRAPLWAPGVSEACWQLATQLMPQSLGGTCACLISGWGLQKILSRPGLSAELTP